MQYMTCIAILIIFFHHLLGYLCYHLAFPQSFATSSHPEARFLEQEQIFINNQRINDTQNEISQKEICMYMVIPSAY